MVVGFRRFLFTDLFSYCRVRIWMNSTSHCGDPIFIIQLEKENGPRTVKDVKLISAGRILENNRTVGECMSPLCDIPGGVTTMHVVVQPPPQEKGANGDGGGWRLKLGEAVCRYTQSFSSVHIN
ncbi:hypothetical protein M9H77_15568 [Catharanthus roseus]|uniref:Uncharacterized protein n=1 Tax=Catharanthus roseus TaxID=4058 RepID=A0ACC0AZF8_CATRO|nr:hypothetical protein M9H77_15568 [Catharanthus roseus]